MTISVHIGILMYELWIQKISMFTVVCLYNTFSLITTDTQVFGFRLNF